MVCYAALYQNSLMEGNMDKQKLYGDSERAVKGSSDIIEQCSGLRFIHRILIDAATESPNLDDGDLVQMAVLMGNALDIIEQSNDEVYRFVEGAHCELRFEVEPNRAALGLAYDLLNGKISMEMAPAVAADPVLKPLFQEMIDLLKQHDYRAKLVVEGQLSAQEALEQGWESFNRFVSIKKQILKIATKEDDETTH